MKDWMKLIPSAELQTYQQAGLSSKLEPGRSPALIVIDVTYAFTGSEGLALEQAIDEFPTACGPVAWDTMPRIGRLIGLFRERQLPIVFTRGAPADSAFTGRATTSKKAGPPNPKANTFPPAIAPRDGEWVLGKTKASCFFGTPLNAYLIRQKIDTLVLCGVSTSGCVRASAVDASSHGYATTVIDDCCFDRSNFAHCANLFDMQAKYASVISLDEMEEWIDTVRAPAGHDAYAG